MRKTSQDGGDSTSITSGFENELKRTSVGIIKTKRNSIKRKVQNFSHESDDTVNEPLLQVDKNETDNRSTKYLLSKSKTDSVDERDSNILYSDNNVEKSSVSKYICATGAISSNTNISRTLHNHMNTNIFGGHDVSKVVTTVKSPVLVEISGTRPAVRSNQTSSIFTTAKIHADSITKNMEPIQVTPVPILSTVEGNVVKAGISSDYAQKKTIIPSTSNSVLKPTGCQGKVQLSNTQYDCSHLAQSEVGKSDTYRSSTEHMLKKLSDVLDNRSTVITTESELKLFNKSCDTKKENIKTSSMVKSTDTEIVRKITPQLKSSINTTSDKKYKSSQEHSNNDFQDNLKSLPKTPDVKDIEVDGKVILQNQNTSNLKSAIVKDHNTKKKEDKNISSTSSGSKQLQRQKNAICESDKLDDDINNDSLKLAKHIISTTTDVIEKDEISSAIIPNTKSKDNLRQVDVSHKADTETEKIMPMSSTQARKPVVENLSSTSITTKEVDFKPTDPVKHSLKHSTASFRSDLAVEKKTVMIPSEIIKPVTENSSFIAVTTKEVSPKVNDTVQSKQSTALIQSDSILKEKLDVKPIDICKPITGNLSFTANIKGAAQKSTTTVPTTQSRDPIKLDSMKENKIAVVSNEINKSTTEKSAHVPVTSKAPIQTPINNIPATTKSTSSNQSVSVKDNKTAASSVQINNSLKDKSIKEGLTLRSFSASADKSSITTDTKGSTKTNTIETSKNAPVSKEISEVGASSGASTDSKNIASILKVQNKTITEDKSIAPITVMPTSTTQITKTEVKSQPVIDIPISAKSSVASKFDPSKASGIKLSTTVSSIPTTANTSTTTRAKSTNQKTTLKTNVLDKHGKI